MAYNATAIDLYMVEKKKHYLNVTFSRFISQNKNANP